MLSKEKVEELLEVVERESVKPDRSFCIYVVSAVLKCVLEKDTRRDLELLKAAMITELMKEVEK